jgi:hypothetical protein
MSERILAELDRMISTASHEQRIGLVVSLAARLAALGASMAAPMPAPAQEKWITIDEALVIVGDHGGSRKWLYRATRGLKFRKNFSRKNVRFEEAAFRRWITSRRR